VRLAELEGRDQEALDLFDSNMSGMQKYAYAWYSALGYKARALWNIGKRPKR